MSSLFISSLSHCNASLYFYLFMSLISFLYFPPDSFPSLSSPLYLCLNFLKFSFVFSSFLYIFLGFSIGLYFLVLREKEGYLRYSFLLHNKNVLASKKSLVNLNMNRTYSGLGPALGAPFLKRSHSPGMPDQREESQSQRGEIGKEDFSVSLASA